MQNSKKILILISAIIVILIIVAFLCIFQGNNINRVDRIYKKLIKNQKYTFSMEETNSENKYKIVVSHRENDINIETGYDDKYTSTLIKDGYVYVIMHDDKEYYVMDGEDTDADIIISGIKDASEKEYEKGKEEINGKTYYYEEYKDITSFIMLAHETEDSNIITRFYFDNNDLVYIKNIIIDEEEKQEELLKVSLRYDVDDSLFEIPEDYAEL